LRYLSRSGVVWPVRRASTGTCWRACCTCALLPPTRCRRCASVT